MENFNLSNSSILLVDDEEHVRKYLSVVVQPLGFNSILEANNGEEAIAIFDAKKPLLTMLDINLPKVTGVDVLNEIIKREPKACVIMLTTIDSRQKIELCAKFEASNYILKGSPPEQILEIITETLKRKGLK